MSWEEDILGERQGRADLYEGPDTPLSATARARFRGLTWYAPDPRYRVAATLARHARSRPAQLASTGDEGMELLEVGVMRFTLRGAPCSLLAYEPAPGEADEPYLLLPFLDATSGRETYGGGRYVDLEPRADDAYTLDLNLAYAPYCAHDDAWSCVLPPPENRLPIRVEAGERIA